MSVREWYEEALDEMRRKIREARDGASRKKLGELLVEQGVLDEGTLQSALIEQEQRGKGELLGEVLLSLNLIEEKTLVATLNIQVSEN